MIKGTSMFVLIKKGMGSIPKGKCKSVDTPSIFEKRRYYADDNDPGHKSTANRRRTAQFV
jgi:hypothetical protein